MAVSSSLEVSKKGVEVALCDMIWLCEECEVLEDWEVFSRLFDLYS